MAGVAQRTVLVVDDEPSIRMLCRVNLELEGYEVREATNLDEARAALSSDGVDVVLLDVHLAHEDGRELLAEIRRDRPAVAVALFTGSYEIAEEEPDAGDALIPKPFTIDELIATVGRLADGRAER
jgi:DNA-binding NtrC family response regulator